MSAINRERSRADGTDPTSDLSLAEQEATDRKRAEQAKGKAVEYLDEVLLRLTDAAIIGGDPDDYALVAEAYLLRAAMGGRDEGRDLERAFHNADAANIAGTNVELVERVKARAQEFVERLYRAARRKHTGTEA